MTRMSRELGGQNGSGAGAIEHTAPAFGEALALGSSLRLGLALAIACLSPLPSASAQTSPGSAQQHLERAHALLAQHKPKEAIPELRAALAAEPGNVDAAANLGVLLYFGGNTAEAEPLLRGAVAAQTVPKLQALLGLCERRNGHTDAARTDLAAALPGLQDAAIRKEAGLQLIELDTAAGDLPAAAGVASQLKAAAPEDPAILYAAYRIYTDLAGEAMLDMSLAAPKSAQMHMAMAHELLRLRDQKAAIANYRQALAADPALPGAEYELAEALRLSPEPPLRAEAAQHYEAALKATPNDAKSLVQLADIHADAGDHERAIGEYRRALQLSPNDTGAAVGLAHELVETGKPAEALPLLQTAEQADPSEVLVHFRLSALYRRLGKPDDAKRELAQYEKYKGIKDRMRALYKEMRQDAPGDDAKQQ